MDLEVDIVKNKKINVQKAIKKDDAIRQNDVDSFHVPGSRCGCRNTLSA